MSDARPSPRLAATVLLVRDRPTGLEVFMVERHHEIDFATGALVFPGGKVDPADADPRLRARCGESLAGDADARALRVAAIRETFEECGVLLAREHGGAGLFARDVADALERARKQPIVTVQPALVRGADGKSELTIPADSGYPPLPRALARF